MYPTTTPTLVTVRETGACQEGYLPLLLETARGPVEARHYEVRDARKAVVWVGGIGGGFDTPARDLYPTLARRMAEEGIGSLRVRFRDPRDLEQALYDLRAGLHFLGDRRVETVALVGHSFGGAVVLQAAAAEPVVRAVVCLAPQSHGGGVIATLGERCPVLLIHGLADSVLPPSCSRSLYRLASGPRELVLLAEAGHCLDEAADEVHARVHDWLCARLAEVLYH